MKNLVIDDFVYYRIYLDLPEKLIKYSSLDINAWNLLKSKNLDFINTPDSVFELNKEEKTLFPYCESKIYLPILNGYKTLVDSPYIKYLDTKNVLVLYKIMVTLLKKMHNSRIIHSDINATNIMINKNLDIKFIDFDTSIIDDYISRENIYLDEGLSKNKVISNSIADDKIELLIMFLYYLANGCFEFNENRYVNLSSLNLNDNMTEEIRAYINGKVKPIYDYYFEDIIDDLLEIGYEAPLCKRKI